ncbi:MAG: glycoside hydrolase family 30 beta sandwich domain-containing protein [Acholeplasmataceae bacterium]|jgi:glucosylceramidase|nr:glycoside hydrolase family 30 beta sandwich domain-containing protein [Acholeplasmataceae bacterium]
MRKLTIFITLILLVFLVSCVEETDTDPTTPTVVVTEPTVVPTDPTEETIIVKSYSITPFVTRGDKVKLLTEDPSFVTDTVDRNTLNTVEIDLTQTYQSMDGFGAAMTESSAYLFSNLTEEQRETVMSDLFSKEGINMSFVRIPMGASDFALDNYSYNDIPTDQTDLEMTQFSLSRDEQYVIPMLQIAKEKNPSLLLMGSPWSAPAWMKDTKTMNGGSLMDIYHDAYAKYFVKFIQGYDAAGLPIYAVTPQNEPLHQTTNYPTMYMTAMQQVQFVRTLGETFQANNIESLIIAYDHNWDKPSYPNTVIGSPVSQIYTAGAAFHCYGGSVEQQNTVNKIYPNKGIWFTECSGGRWATNFSSNMSWNMENVFIGSINAFSKSVLMWNIALDDQDGPQNGGCSNCRGVVTIHEDGSYTRNEEYYMIGHFSKFVDQGAVRVASSSSNENLILSTFKNPDGKIVMVMHNKSNSSLTFNLNIDGSNQNYMITGRTTVSFVLEEIN